MSHRTLLIGIALAAILARIVTFSLISPPTGGTARYYESVAESLLRGDGFNYYPYVLLDRNMRIPKTFENIPKKLEDIGVDMSSDTRYAIRAPLYRYPPAYPIFLAAAHFVFGPSPVAVVVLQILLNGLAAALVYRIAWLIFEVKSLAAAAGAAAALWPFTLVNSLSYEPTALLYVTVISAVWSMMEYRLTGRAGYFLLSALASGISAMLRTDALFASFGLAAALLLSTGGWMNRVKACGGFLLITAAVMSPWLIRNAVVYQRFVPLSCGLGVNLVIGIGKYIPESGFPTHDRAMIVEEYGQDHVNSAMYTDDGCYPAGVEREEERVNRAKAYIRGHVWEFAGSCVRRLPDLLFVGGQTVQKRVGSGQGGWRALVGLGLTWVEPLAVCLAVAGFWRLRRRWAILSPVSWSIVLYIIGHAPMWVEPRYFKPVWPLVLVLTVGAFYCGKKFDTKLDITKPVNLN